MGRPRLARCLRSCRQLSGAATSLNRCDSLAPMTAAFCATIDAEDVNGQSSTQAFTDAVVRV
jgi:hypothetical protein